MPFDLALTPQGDLIFSAGRDLEHVEGAALMNQRIMTRLRMIRNAWPYDRELGSSLNLILSKQLTQGEGDIDAIIREALDPIADEIDIVAIHVDETDLRQLTAVLEYRLVTPAGPDTVVTQAAIVIPTGGS